MDHHEEANTTWLVDGILAMATVALAVFVPKIKDKQHQRISTYVWVMCIFIVFSGLMNLFKLKNGAYPFRILFWASYNK